MAEGTETEAPTRYCGRKFTPKELALIHDVVESCSGLSRKEIAQTVCELLGWRRPSGALKAQECREFLERLQSAGALALPQKQPRRPLGSRTRVPVTVRGDRGRDLVGAVGDFAPIEIELVGTADQRLLFRELVGRYHYLGHAVPFGLPARTRASSRDRAQPRGNAGALSAPPHARLEPRSRATPWECWRSLGSAPCPSLAGYVMVTGGTDGQSPRSRAGARRGSQDSGGARGNRRMSV